MGNILHLYRFFTKEKVSSMRLLLYVMLGLVLSGSWAPVLFVYDLLFVLGGIMFASMLNDYYDFKLLGEENSIGKLISNNKISKKRIFMMIWLPCLLPLGLFYPMILGGASIGSMIMLTVSFFLSLFYCAPPMRFKERVFIGIITPPIGIYLLFLQAVVLLKMPDFIQWMICGLIFLFTWYLDFIHLANDSVSKNELIKISGRNSLKAAKLVGIIAIVSSIAAIPFNYIGCVSLILWSIRLIKIWNLKPDDIKALRKSIFSHIYCIEEFVVYAFWGLLCQVRELPF